MAIEAQCDSCGRVLRAKDSAAGKRAKCPDCGAVVQIPDDTASGREFDYDLSHADEEPDFDGLDEVGPLEVGAPEFGGDRRPCPACGEMIKANAKKCRFCGEVFDSSLKSQGGADADLTTAEYVVAILCSGIGCIFAVIWMIQGKPKGSKMLGVSLIAWFCWFMINVAIQALNQR